MNSSSLQSSESKPENGRLAQKQNELLLELSATASALSSLDQVLRDIVSLTTLENPGGIADKQEKLLAELRKWKEL